MDLVREASGVSVPQAAAFQQSATKGSRMALEVVALAISEVKLIRTPRHGDARGYFSETYQRSDFTSAGISNDFLQDNQSRSAGSGTIRGLHFQRPPFAQSKLIRVLHGRILDVVVDLRRSSSTFSKHLAIELSADGNEQLLVPAGFAHGFCTLEPDTVVFYKVDQDYSAVHDGGVNWADPALGITWPVSASEAILSDKDRRLPKLADLPDIFE
jgi:dTDP-4-dehydrorhamnose 3,5-epimerase